MSLALLSRLFDWRDALVVVRPETLIRWHRNELQLKLGLRVSPRTVRKYMPKRPPGRPRGDQRWATFLRNHASATVACDFFVAVTATFRLLYVFVVIEHGSRRVVRVAVTTHATAAWSLQQLREVVGFDRAQVRIPADRDRSSGSAAVVRCFASVA